MAKLCCSPGLRQKTRTTRFIGQEPRMNYFECDLATEIRVERFVCHTHGAPTEFDGDPGIISNQLVLIEATWPASIGDIFVVQRSAKQTIDATAICAVGRAESRTALRADRLSRIRFNALRLVHALCAKALQR
jgi:hypothetical protein